MLCRISVIDSTVLTLCSKNVLLESRIVDLSTDEEGETEHSSESKDGQSSSSNSSSSLEEEFSSIGW